MESLTTGEINILLGDEEITLKPTLRAMTQIARQYGGLEPARKMLVAEHPDAVAFIIRIGANMNDREVRDLPQRIYRNGITGDLLVGLIRYVATLGNAGKPVDIGEDEEDNSKVDDSGNVSRSTSSRRNSSSTPQDG